ncbi:MAG: ABC transporter permease [Acidobacteria bacterium]|nr:ABC transporter permease [Acidobacteriota bacterium]MCA1609619.1 ABC transporter permease [Acidobacteriota bacterium]
MSRRDLSIVLHLFLGSARLQKKRAFLTIASIAWGTVTILLLLAFGEGLKRQFARNEQAMGTNLAINWPGETSKVWKGLPEGRAIKPRIDDIPLLQQRMPDVQVWGEMSNSRTLIQYARKTVNARVIGPNWVYGDPRRHYAMPGGRFLGPQDEEQKRRVVFLGNELAEDLFGKENPVGKTVLVNSSPFTVIGVMQRKTQTSAYGGQDKDHAVIPITTFRALFGRDKLNVVVVHTETEDEMESALERMRTFFAGRYSFDAKDERVFGTWNTVKGQRISAKIFLGMEMFFGIIGALTLVIGCVGVANIMYAVVKERTREIGVKMALGARRGWITGPFILEGLVYTLLGGLAGAVIAILIVTVLGLLPQEDMKVLEFLGKPTLSWSIGAATVAILGTAGLLAGYFPARRAAAIDPAATLRYE